MVQQKIQIKGIREGLLLITGEGDWDEIHQSILVQLDEQAGFLKGDAWPWTWATRSLKLSI